MENKRMAMIVVMMLVMVNVLIETEAIGFKECYTPCVEACGTQAQGLKKLLCPFTCIKNCMNPKFSLEAKLNDHTDFFCKLGCATDRCVSSSSIDDKDHVEKVSGCVESCSEMCAHKN